MPSPNLVQIQRDLQMLPPGPQTMMYLKRAKDGMVASVPPYLAAAELAGREKMAQRQALSDGAASGEQPTVSQQLSQKADLLALQAMKKKEMDAAAMNQARGAVGPAPEGTPEPEEQPRRESGLDQLPVEFGFDGGGIVAFQEGGRSIYDTSRDPLVQAMNRSQPTAQNIADLDPEFDENGNPRPKSQRDAILAAKAQLRGVRQNVSDYQRLLEQKRGMQGAMVPAEAMRRMEEFYPANAWAQRTEQPATGSPPSPPAAIPPEILAAYGPGAERMPQVQATAQQRPPAPPGAQQRPPAQTAQAPAQPAAPQTPGQPTTADLRAALMSGVGLTGAPAEAAAATQAAAPQNGLTQAGADVKALAASMGLGTPAGAEERELIAQMRARQEQRAQGRARRDLREVLLGFGRGYGGAAAASIGAEDRAYAEDMQHQRQMYDLINAINSGNRKEAEGIFNKAMSIGESREKEAGAMKRAEMEQVGAMSRSKLQALSQMYSAELQAGSSKYNTDAHVRVALAQAERAGRSNDLQERRLSMDGLQSAERGVQTELTSLQGKLDPESRKRRAKLENDLKDLRTRISALSGADKLAPTTETAPTAATKGRVLNWADIK